MLKLNLLLRAVSPPRSARSVSWLIPWPQRDRMPQTQKHLIWDAHLDLAWNALDWNRNLHLPVSAIRQREQEQGMTQKGRGCGTVSFHDLRRGKVGIFIATLLPRLLRANLMPAIQRYESMTAAQAASYGQMAYYRALEREG